MSDNKGIYLNSIIPVSSVYKEILISTVISLHTLITILQRCYSIIKQCNTNQLLRIGFSFLQTML